MVSIFKIRYAGNNSERSSTRLLAKFLNLLLKRKVLELD